MTVPETPDTTVATQAVAESAESVEATPSGMSFGLSMAPRLWFYLLAVAVMYGSGVLYAAAHGLSIKALYLYGLLQEPGIAGEAARLTEITTPLSWNIPLVAWYVYIKGCGVLVELFQYWLIGMFIAGGLVVFVSWEAVKSKMGFGGFKANLAATTAGAVIPICSCGIVPVLAGMAEAGIPLGPTMAFLISAPMLNVPTVFMTAGVLGWPMAVARIIATFGIALTVGQILSTWQRKHPNPRRYLKVFIPPRLSPEEQQFAFRFAVQATKQPDGVRAEQMGAEAESMLLTLEQKGVVERTDNGLWTLPEASGSFQTKDAGACGVLPTDEMAQRRFGEKCAATLQTGIRLFVQLNGYLLLAVLIAGAIKVLLPTSLITEWVGGTALNSVLVAAVIAVLAYVCTYVEVPTALALMSKGMGPGSTLAYLLGGPGLSLPSIAMLSGVFRPKVLAMYVCVSFVGCVVAGYLFNLV